MSYNNSQDSHGGSWIVEQLTLQLADVELASGRRAWHEARSSWPGTEAEFWWKWAAEAIESIGFANRIIDCSWQDTRQLIENGMQLITWRPATDSADPNSDGEWISIRPLNARRCEVRLSGAQSEVHTVPPKQAISQLQAFEHNGTLRAIVVRADVSLGSHDTHKMKPLPRLIALLRPEWPDIWLVLVFAFVVGLLMLATPIAVESLVNTVAFGGVRQPIAILALILLTFLAFSGAMRALQTWVTELVQRRLFARVAGDLAYRLPRAVTDPGNNHYLPELTNRFFDVVTVQKVVAQLLLDGVGLVLTAFIGMAVLAFYHPWLLGFDVVMMASIAFIILILGRGAVSSAVRESKHKYYMASWLEDIARCPTTFRAAGGATLALERTDRLVHEYLEARRRHFGILMRQILFALGLQAVASTALLGLGGWLVIDGQLTLGQLVAAELIVTVIVGAFAKLGKHMESFYDLLAAVDKLGALFDIPVEHYDGLLTMPTEGPAPVTVDTVSCRLPDAVNSLPSVNCQVDAGGSCAVFGRAGCGKSTLLDIIYGLRRPTAGHLLVDGVDPQDLRADVLRRRVALVRRSEVFHGSVEENVHLQRSDVTASDVRHAIEDVGLTDQILQLPAGFDTQLNGDGLPLSARQRDLLGLARAIAGRPGLLLIDGVLDGLSDPELDQVMSVLFSPARDWTLIVATGRESIARRCEQIVELSPSPVTSTGGTV